VATPRTLIAPGIGYFAHVVDVDGNLVGLHAAD
jgi:predicted enzyme related to lactoylglutathione lyase